MLKNNVILRTVFLLLLAFAPVRLYGAQEVLVDFSINRDDNGLYAYVSNGNENSVLIKVLDLTFNGSDNTTVVNKELGPKQSDKIYLAVTPPRMPGSYVAAGYLTYENGAALHKLAAADTFNYGSRSDLPIEASMKVFNGRIEIAAPPGKVISENCRLVIPGDLHVSSTSSEDGVAHFAIMRSYPNSGFRYSIFLTEESITTRNGKNYHSAGVNRYEYFAGARAKTTSPFIFPAFSLLFMLSVVLQVKFSRGLSKGRDLYLAAYLTFSLTLILFTFWVFNIPGLFYDNNYGFFRHYASYAYLAVFAAYYLYEYSRLRKLDKDGLLLVLSTRKTWIIYSFLASIIKPAILKEPVLWSPKVRTALLSVVVKFQFLPLMWTWTWMKIVKMLNLNYAHPDKFLLTVTFLILFLQFIDDIVYSFAYAFEGKRLNSEIRSVEPTLFGWLVCLCCYPPLYNITYMPVSVLFPALKFGYELGQPVSAALQIFIVLMWFIYTSASVALGFKASNLTNRGIVAAGPYKYVRHPAYIAKNFAWIGGFFLYQQASVIALLLGLFIYHLRAVTEERHLKMDPDYIEYMKKVRWRYIPGLY